MKITSPVSNGLIPKTGSSGKTELVWDQGRQVGNSIGEGEVGSGISVRAFIICAGKYFIILPSIKGNSVVVLACAFFLQKV